MDNDNHLTLSRVEYSSDLGALMASSFVHYTCCLIILTVFVDWGDGRGKKSDREILQDDVALFRKMADKIKDDIEEFYDEYPDEKLSTEEIKRLRYRYVWSRITDTNWTTQHLNNQDIRFLPRNETVEALTNIPLHDTDLAQNFKIISSRENHKILFNANKNKIKSDSWPKFEDMLLAIGKRYDWKNDRWIKVKRKLYSFDTDIISHRHSIDFSVKHKFYYRIVKLKRSKNKRNVVVAVSAVR
ncbi:hypothetical protein evm_004082 [Chilo suppressalis]|nr:hypothetical protein evm_004082 [Chilo suppressalis]